MELPFYNIIFDSTIFLLMWLINSEFLMIGTTWDKFGNKEPETIN